MYTIIKEYLLFSVLYRLLGNKFDLNYYDGLANQDEPIVLTIGEIIDTWVLSR